MFRILILVVFILNQVYCSTTVCNQQPYNITREVSTSVGSIIWRRDGAYVRDTAFPCSDPQTDQNYSVYCFDTPSNRYYILEIRQPEYHDLSTFTESITLEETTLYLRVPANLSSHDLTTNIPNPIAGYIFNVSVSIPCSKPQPRFIWNFNASKTTIPYTIESTQTSTDNTGCTSSLLNRESSLSVNLNDWDPEITNTDGDIEISVDVKFGECEKVPSTPVTVKYIAPGSPSSPPTPSTSTSLQPTSSAPNPSTKVSSESSTSSNPTPTPPCVNLICDCDKICIIISVCVGSLIVIVVIVLCCCCCPFCPCYKRKGTGCKFCCKKKTSDRNSNSNKTKRASRPEQYEMPRANQSDQMHSYSDYHVSGPDQRARASDTGFPHPNDSRYGQGYNNAAFVYPGENERRSNKDRKPRVIQRPYTNHYYFS